MAGTEYTKGLIKDNPTMLSELCQEFHRLKQNPIFVRNLCFMSLTFIASTISAAGIYAHPHTIAKQEKCDRLFQVMSAGAVIKINQDFTR